MDEFTPGNSEPALERIAPQSYRGCTKEGCGGQRIAEVAFEEGRAFEREQRQQPIASESYRQGCADIIDAVTAADERRLREQRDLQIVCHDSDVGRLRRALVAANRHHLLGNVLPSPYAPRGTAYLVDRSQSERNVTIEGLTE